MPIDRTDAMHDSFPDDDAVLAQFNRLIQELLRGNMHRNTFRPWEVELLLDIEACNLRESTKRETLKRYQKAVQRQMEKGARLPMKLSEYLEKRRSQARRSKARPRPHRLSRRSFLPHTRAKGRYPEFMGCGGGSIDPRTEETNKSGHMVHMRQGSGAKSRLDKSLSTSPAGPAIYDNVSKEAWKMWLEQMKMIMKSTG